MTLERIVIGIIVFIGALMIILGWLGYSFFELAMPIALLLIIIGISIIILTIVIYFIII
ncbi:MAG: hypothetical protein ACTSRI_07610 [Promethearchaeota archaeon]